MKRIPLYIVEEHHEAFFIWNYAIYRGFLPATDNKLLHIDEHSDMSSSTYNMSLDSIVDLDIAKKFTHNELHIANFILPAVYRNIINEVTWVRQSHSASESKTLDMYVRTYNNDGRKIIMGKKADLNFDGNVQEVVDLENNIRNFHYSLRHLSNLTIKDNTILDIDLDFFSCTGDPNKTEEIYIPTNETEYLSFINNPYHRLKFLGFRIDAQKINNEYYYIINNYNAVYESSLNVGEEVICQRIDDFIYALAKQQIKPAIIDICRSRHSGFTPADKWEFIEQQLIDKLEAIYDIEIHFINKLINGHA